MRIARSPSPPTAPTGTGDARIAALTNQLTQAAQGRAISAVSVRCSIARHPADLSRRKRLADPPVPAACDTVLSNTPCSGRRSCGRRLCEMVARSVSLCTAGSRRRGRWTSPLAARHERVYGAARLLPRIPGLRRQFDTAFNRQAFRLVWRKDERRPNPHARPAQFLVRSA